MKIVFIGTVAFSGLALEKLIRLKANIVGVVTKKKSPLNADFMDLSGICRKHGIPFKYVVDINSPRNVQ